MIHLRIVAVHGVAEKALEILEASPSACSVVHLPGAAKQPPGDLILCDVAREDASVIVDDLEQIGVHIHGSISLEALEGHVSRAADRAAAAAAGAPSDAVVWEEVEDRTADSAELSGSFLAFMVIATMIAGIGVFLDSPILIIGAMVVGPEFGPIAGFCVAAVERSGSLAKRSLAALAAGFPLAMAVTFLASLAFKELGVAPDGFTGEAGDDTDFIANPDLFSFVVAALAGTAGVLSLTTAKSGALIGVLISVTTIPAAGNVGVAAAYSNWEDAGGSLLQLSINLGAIVAAGVATLLLQRAFFLRRRERHRESLSAGRASERGPDVDLGAHP